MTGGIMQRNDTRDSLIGPAGVSGISGTLSGRMPGQPGATLTLSRVTMGLIGAPLEGRLWCAIGGDLRDVSHALGHLLAVVLLLLARIATLALLPLSVPCLYLLARREQRRVARRYAARIATPTTPDSDVFLGL
jgi:hypothetical protein